MQGLSYPQKVSFLFIFSVYFITSEKSYAYAKLEFQVNQHRTGRGQK